MVLTWLSKNRKQVIIKISGENFNELLEIVNHEGYGLTYKSKFYEVDSKVWLADIRDCEEVLGALMECDGPFAISEEIEKESEKVKIPETRKIRNPFYRNCLTAEPIGPFQIRAISIGAQQNRLYLAHKMGLGKTFMVVGILNHLFYKSVIDKILIIAPTESIINFKREILRFNSFDLKESEIYVASRFNRDPFNSDARVVIMTYRTFLMISDDAYKKTHKKVSKKYRTACIPFEKWGTNRAIILDEAHMIKNRQARSSSVLHLHKHFFDFRYLLSGTPYPMGAADLYSQINFLDPVRIPLSYQNWIKTIAFMGDRFSEYSLVGYKEDKVKEFLKSVEDLIIREFTEDNIKLPEKITKNIYVELGKKQKAIYQSFVTYILDANKSKNGRVVMREIFDNFPYLSLALENPSILEGKVSFQKEPKLFKMIEKWKFEDHSKIPATTSLLKKYVEEENHKTIIWSGHPKTIKQLGEYYKKYDPIILHGEMEVPRGISRAEYRDKLVEKFKNDDKHKIIIASYLMIARAVNITEAPRAICFDRPWSFEIWDQLQKRNHRIGTTEMVIMNPIIIEHSLEERQEKVLKKRELIDKDLLNYDSLTQEDWKSLFEGVDLD